MAVYCSVCATRIGSASENEGSFSATMEFDGVVPGRIRKK